MRVIVAYIYPNISSRSYDSCARRFSIQFSKYDPGHPYELYVVVNGGRKISPLQQKLFEPLTPNFIPHDNSGKDLGAYQKMARTIPCDLLVCLGAPTRPRMNGWLGLMVKAVQDYGPGIYGCWGFHAPAPHIRTTCFWLPPEILNEYPYQITDKLRYHAEHSHESITMFCKHHGLATMMVTTKGVFHMEQWHHVPQGDCLCLDQHSDRIHYHDDGGGW